LSTSNNNSTIQYSIDATGFEAGVNKIKAGASTVNAAQDAMAKRAALVDAAMKEAAANGFDLNARAANKLAAEYQRLTDTVGKTQAQILAQKAANNGVTSTFANMQSQIAAASAETHGFSLATAASKRELIVLAHELSQGNYKKFGGSLMVLAEQTGAAGLLFSGLGVAALAGAAAVAGVAYEAYQGYAAFEALNKSIAATNGYTGLTSSQMADLAKSLGAVSINVADTEQIMASLVSSGVIAGSALSASTEAVANFAKQTGMSAEDATQAMIKFAEDPAKALDVLVTKYHEFDGAQVAVIQKYLDAGDKAGAYAKEVEFINDAHAKFAKEGVENLGYLSAAWDYLAKTAHGAMNELNAFGAATSDSVKLADAISAQTAAQLNFNRAVAQGPAFAARAKQAMDAATAQVNAIKQVTAASEAAQKANAARAASGTAELNTTAFLKKYQSNAPSDVRDREKSEAKNAFDALSKDSPSYQKALIAYHEQIKEIDEKYAKSTKTHTASPNAGINAELATVAGQNKLIEAEEKRSETRLKALKDLGVIDADDYYQQLHDIQSKALTEEIANAQQRADIAGNKKEKAAQNTALADVTKLTAQRKALDDDLNDALAKSAQQRNDIIRRYGDTAASAYRDQLAGYRESFDTKDMLPIEKASYDARATMLATFVKNQESVESAYKSHSIDLATRNAELAISQDTYDKQRAALEANLKQEQAIRDSYGDQIQHALIQIAGESQSSAQLAAQAFTSTWSDASNALDTFVTTGKLNFSSLTASILGDLAKIALHAAESQIFSSIASSSFFSAGGSVGHFATGGSISGPGTGTSDSIPAMLSDGEYVVNAASTKKYGSLLESINSGRMSHYASGGAVGSVPAGGGASVSNQHSNTFNLQSGGLTQQDVVALLPQLQTVIDKRISQRFSGQGGLAWKMKYNQI